MTPNPSLIFNVRLELNDVPDEYLSDEVISYYLTKAEYFINTIKREDASQESIDVAITSLASYYCYVAYTELVTRKIGTIPEYNQERINNLKSMAYNYINIVAAQPIDENLNLLNPKFAPIGFGLVGILP